MTAPRPPETLPKQPPAAPSEAVTVPPRPDGPAREEGTPAVPGYEVLGTLGRGGMGVVYRARHLGLDRPVALKMILAAGHADEAEVTRFLAEAQALAALQHPNVVQVHDSGRHDGRPFMALELVPGGSLHDRLNGGPLPPAEAARLVEGVARGVQAAHAAGIVHRDLKPGNVLLAADGTPKVTDFGLAKRVEGEDAGLTRTGAVLGTPSYMAPEQAGGDGKRVGPAADVYALGAILYECLTGRPPFRAAGVMDTLLLVLTTEPLPVRALQPAAPRDLETICLKCLHKEPGKRYATAAALADDLRRWRAGEPILARPAGRLEKAVKWARRRPAVAALLAAVVAVTLAGVGGVLWAYGAARRERDRANGKAAEAEKAEQKAADRAEKEAAARKRAEEKERDALFQARRAEHARHFIQLERALRAWEQFDLNEAEEALRQVDEAFQQTWETRYVQGLCRRRALRLVGHTGPVQCMAFSPDGRLVVTGGSADNNPPRVDRTARIWDAGTGRQLRVLTGHTGGIFGVAFSPCGDVVLTGSADGTARLWDTETGRELRVLRGHADEVRGVAFSPDGKTILTGGLDGTAWLWDAGTGKAKRVFCGHRAGVTSVTFSPNGKRALTGSRDGTARLWDVEAGRELRVLGEVWAFPVTPESFVIAAFSPDGAKALTRSHVTLQLWDVETGRELRVLKARLLYGRSGGVAFSPDGEDVLGVDYNRVRVWEMEASQHKFALTGPSGQITSAVWGPDGRRIATGSPDGTACVWDLMSYAPTLILESPPTTSSVVFGHDGKRIISGHGDGTVRLWDATTGQQQRLIGKVNEGVPVRSVSISPDGKRIARGGYALHEAATGQEVPSVTLSFASHGNRPFAAFSPDGKVLAIWGGEIGNQPWGALLLDAVTGQEKARLQGIHCWHLAYSPDGKRIATVDGDSRLPVRLWDAETGKPLLTLEKRERISTVAFSPDGKLLATAGNAVRLWDAETGEERGHVGHKGIISCVAFSPDGTRLLTGGGDRTLRLWDVETGQEKLKIALASAPSSVAFSPGDGRLIAAGLEWGPVQVWEASPDQPAAPP
jgi:WD40 repeat protein